MRHFRIEGQPDGLALGPLRTPAEILRDAAAPAALAAMARHVLGLTAPHPGLGRAGAICPFAQGSLQRDLIGLAVSPLDRIDAAAVTATMLWLRDAFVAGAKDRDAAQRSVVVVFPALPPQDGAALIDRVQKALKPEFVAAGLMIGEFYPGCPAPGLHNPAFRPFDTPEIALAIRAVTPQDAPFMTGDPRCLAAFEAWFGRADG